MVLCLHHSPLRYLLLQPPSLLWLTGTSAPTKWESFTLPGPEEPALGIHVVLDPGPVSLLYVEPVLEVAEDPEYEERVQLLLLVLPLPVT